MAVNIRHTISSVPVENNLHGLLVGLLSLVHYTHVKHWTTLQYVPLLEAVHEFTIDAKDSISLSAEGVVQLYHDLHGSPEAGDRRFVLQLPSLLKGSV